MLRATELLALWDECQPLPTPAARARALVASATAGSDRQPTVGQANVTLLELYSRLAGPLLTGIADCPACAAELTVELEIASLTAQALDAVEQVTVEFDGARRVVRVPSIDDLAASPASGDELLRACVQRVDDPGRPKPDPDVPISAPWRRAIEDALATADPMAEISVTLTCPGCASSWTETLDPGAFVWAELDAEARRVARDVFELTRVYGWREADITSLTPWRRRLYLEAAGA